MANLPLSVCTTTADPVSGRPACLEPSVYIHTTPFQAHLCASCSQRRVSSSGHPGSHGGKPVLTGRGQTSAAAARFWASVSFGLAPPPHLRPVPGHRGGASPYDLGRLGGWEALVTPLSRRSRPASWDALACHLDTCSENQKPLSTHTPSHRTVRAGSTH